MDPKPRRLWWKKKRWWAAGVLWLALSLPLLCGPLRYAVIRGWLPKSAESAFVWPGLWPKRLPFVGRAFGTYHWWWVALAYEQEGWTVHWEEGGVSVSRHSLNPPPASD
ncbi:MAG TPA: hypothetical protein VF170_11680 [Planctomycetaceae bacterium]